MLATAGRWKEADEARSSGGIGTTRAAVKRLLQIPSGPLEDRVAAGSSIGYDGEELGNCEALTLEQITPALPPVEHGGAIRLESVFSLETSDLLWDPAALLREDFAKPVPRISANVHFGKGEKLSVCSELVKRGVCTWIKSEQVVTFKGVRILNVLFGVKKPSLLPDGRPVLRLIMNLKPSNSILRQVRGAVSANESIGYVERFLPFPFTCPVATLLELQRPLRWPRDWGLCSAPDGLEQQRHIDARNVGADPVVCRTHNGQPNS